MPLVPALVISSLASLPIVDEESLLAAVPDDAFAVLRVADPVALRSRLERNAWADAYAALEGEPALLALEQGYEAATGTDYDGLFELALELQGEALLFVTSDVAGFLTEPPSDRTALLAALNRWLPPGPQRTVDLAGGRVLLVAWPETPGGSIDRSGHYLALLDHPLALGLFSGDSSEAVLASLSDSSDGLHHDNRAAVVEGFLAAGGGTTPGLEGFVDFAPFVDDAEAALRQAVKGVLPDPTGLLGLEQGTWLFASADVSPGTRVEVRAKLAIPEDTLAARLADCYEPLPRALAGELPRGTWATWAVRCNLNRFYETARAGLETRGNLIVVDQGMAVAEAVSGLDPIEDVLKQLAGWSAWYHVLQDGALPDELPDGFGFLVGLVPGNRFLEALQPLLGDEGIGVDAIDVDGAESYLATQEGFLGAEPGDFEGIDGGVSFLPKRLLASLSRRTLERGLRALQQVGDAGLVPGSPLQLAFDEHAGAFAFGYAELAHVRTLAEREGAAPLTLESDPFDAHVVVAAHRTARGLQGHLFTR